MNAPFWAAFAVTDRGVRRRHQLVQFTSCVTPDPLTANAVTGAACVCRHHDRGRGSGCADLVFDHP